MALPNPSPNATRPDSKGNLNLVSTYATLQLVGDATAQTSTHGVREAAQSAQISIGAAKPNKKLPAKKIQRLICFAVVDAATWAVLATSAVADVSKASPHAPVQDVA